MIPVTKSFVPPQDEYQAFVERAFSNAWLTNRGELVQELESKLKTYLGVNHLTCTTNGTLPIQIAIKALGLSGEIITTPFSYIATTSSIVWEGCTPVFVDIDPVYWTIDETKIEAAITSKTSAILATHVFGNPCNLEVIKAIANKYNLKVIYDAAHCFGVTYKGQSIFNYGDVSTCSFHATKIFHTGEGGCWVTKNEELQRKMFYHHNFGHNGPEEFHGLGINAKMSELQAAMGLAVFTHLDSIMEARRKAVNYYKELLNKTNLQMLTIRPEASWNYHYFPILFDTEEHLIQMKSRLNSENIFPRRYFYPSLNKLPYIVSSLCKISEDISRRILCLPLYDTILSEEIDTITKLLKNE